MNNIKETLAIVKEELKAKAKKLSALKIEIKEMMRSGKYAGRLQSNLIDDKCEWRHLHIAYCMVKGRKLEEIESNCHEDNSPNLAVVQMHIDKWTADAN
jgi:hypothetical protein